MTSGSVYQGEIEHVNFMTFKEGVTSGRFWLMFAILYFGLFYGVYMASVYKTTAQDTLDDHTLTLAGALGSVCNGSSRIMWASIQDKFGFKRVYFCLLLIQIVMCFSIFYLKSYAFLYVSCICFSFLCEGGHFSMFPTAAAKIFGIQNAG